jgi:hypothetical protein
VSSGLAIASVSAVLVDLVNNGLIDHDVGSSVGAVSVSALPPDRITVTGPNLTSQVNLFLYRVTPNAAWRNVGLPARSSNGDLVSDHPLALDLHYLVTAYGASDFHGEILLGYAMQILHDTPVLSRDAIRASLAPPTPVASGGSLPANLRSLFTSGLADQFEQIRITPENLSTEEISKLWSAFQTNYRPTSAYVASVVLIDSRRRPRAALPVTSRGLRVLPFEQPVIDRIRVEDPTTSPPIAAGPVFSDSLLVIDGQNLRGEGTTLLISGQAAALIDVQPERIRAALPTGLAAGVHGVQVVHELQLGSPPVPHRWLESNAEAIVLRPRIQSVGLSSAADQGNGFFSAVVDLTLDPAVGPEQRVVLLLNELVNTPGARPRSYTFVAPPRPLSSPPSSPPSSSTLIRVPISGVASGSYLVRVQVDGAESPLSTDSSGAFDGPQRSIP